jgi:hypothetical protein
MQTPPGKEKAERLDSFTRASSDDLACQLQAQLAAACGSLSVEAEEAHGPVHMTARTGSMGYMVSAGDMCCRGVWGWVGLPVVCVWCSPMRRGCCPFTASVPQPAAGRPHSATNHCSQTLEPWIWDTLTACRSFPSLPALSWGISVRACRPPRCCRASHTTRRRTCSALPSYSTTSSTGGCAPLTHCSFLRGCPASLHVVEGEATRHVGCSW